MQKLSLKKCGEHEDLMESGCSKVSEFLTAQQVASFFSRMAAKVKQQTVPGQTLSDQEILAMEEEQNLSSAKGAVIAALHVKHPINFEYNICSMVKDNTLAKLKLGVLTSLRKVKHPIAKRPEKKSTLHISSARYGENLLLQCSLYLQIKGCLMVIGRDSTSY